MLVIEVTLSRVELYNGLKQVEICEESVSGFSQSFFSRVMQSETGGDSEQTNSINLSYITSIY